MPDTTATIIDNLYEAWNRHDAVAIAGSFAAGGVSADPLTRVDLSGDNLTNRVQSLLEVRNRRGDGCTRHVIGSGSPTTRSVTVATTELL